MRFITAKQMEEDFQTELTEDLISIIHHFSMKMYSNRRKMLKLTQQNLEQYKYKLFKTF